MAFITLPVLQAPTLPLGHRSSVPLKNLSHFVNELAWNRFDENKNYSWFTNGEIGELCRHISRFKESLLSLVSFTEAKKVNALFFEFFIQVVHRAAFGDAQCKVLFCRQNSAREETSLAEVELDDVLKRIHLLATLRPLNETDLSQEKNGWNEPILFTFQHLIWKLDLSGEFGQPQTEQKDFVFAFVASVYEFLKLTRPPPINPKPEWISGS